MKICQAQIEKDKKSIWKIITIKEKKIVQSIHQVRCRKRKYLS